MSSAPTTLAKDESLIPLDKFMTLSDEQREAYVAEKVKHSGVVALKLLDVLVEPTDPNRIALLQKVSGQSVAGLPLRKGGFHRHSGKETRRKKN